MGYLSFIRKSFRLDVPVIFNDTFGRKDPYEFKATGSQIFHGRQRQGKTLSMMEGFHRLKRRYPRLLIVSNLNIYYRIDFKEVHFWKFTFHRPYKRPFKPYWVSSLADFEEIEKLPEFQAGKWQSDNYIRYQPYDVLLQLLKKCRNSNKLWGVNFQIDEIHQYFHSHDSKSMPVWVSQIFSQQMKQYILVTGTVQKWENVIKALREQIENLILCTRSGWRISQTVIDPEDIQNEYGEMTAPIKKRGGFFMTRLVRESYDTLALIESGREIFGGSENTTIVAVKEQENKRKFYPRKRTAKIS